MANNQIIGWDVGGAHLKAAHLNNDGTLLNVIQIPCALWRGLAELETAIEAVLKAFTRNVVMNAITMTGELVDLFPSRQAGVQAISQILNAKLNGVKQYYAQDVNLGALPTRSSGFVPMQQVGESWQYIASVNWLASANYIAQNSHLFSTYPLNTPLHKITDGLFIDIGSTTSDFVRLENNKPVCIGFTDATRLQSQELVYTGVIRTPLMAITQRIKFKHAITSVATEYFATTADVYRLTGDLVATMDTAETSDGKEKTLPASARRIARMIGHDVEDAALESWIELAHEFKKQQRVRLKKVAMLHISRLKNYRATSDLFIIGAGVGSFLIQEIAENLGIVYFDSALIIKTAGNATFNGDCASVGLMASVCLPAVAVAYLAFSRLPATSN